MSDDSEHPFDALRYAPGPILHRVELRGDITPHGTPVNKHVGRQRRILASLDATPLLRRFAADQALSVSHMWTMPTVVGEYLTTLDESLRKAALEAALDTAWAAWDAAWEAAWAARAAAWAAREAAWDAAWEAARAAAREAAREAARAAARAAAREAAREAARAAARAAELDAWDATDAARGDFNNRVCAAFAAEGIA